MARTKSREAHQKVIDATLALFQERGIDATSMDAIAEASGVSKATVYKHWPDKDALALEALSLLFGLYEEPPKFDSGDLRRDLIDALLYQPAENRQEAKNHMMPHVWGYAARNQKFGDQWRSRVIEAPQTRLKNLLKRGVKQRSLGAKLDLEVGVAMLLGPMLYWHIVVARKQLGPVPRTWAEQIVGAFWRAYGKKKTR